MFPSSNIDTFPQLQPYFHVPPFIPFAGHINGVLLHQNHDLLESHLFMGKAPDTGTINNTLVSTKAALADQNINRLCGDDCDPFNLTSSKKSAVGKDRHQKIFTAKGPRDRRVRLSIEISRRFFGLQDMLGFDKASKTLDWLFNKSRTAINELVQMKHACSSHARILSFTSECELVSRNMPLADVTREKKQKRTRKASFHLLARELRAKARARARERTSAKMIAKKLPDSSPPIPNQPRSWSQIETCKKLGDPGCHYMFSFLKVDAAIREPQLNHLVNGISKKDMIDESIVIKRKVKSSPIVGFQQNPIISNDVNPNSNSCFPSIMGNWGMSSPITHQGLAAMTKMNQSTVVQFCSKPWQIYKM